MIKHIGRRAGILMAAFGWGVLLPCQATFGQVFSWINATTGTYSVAANWTPAGGPPVALGNTARFNRLGAYTVVLTTNPGIGTFQAATGSPTFNTTGQTLSAANAIDFNAGVIASWSGGTLSSGGTVTMNNLAQVSINGGGDLITTGSVFVGSTGGSATLAVTNSSTALASQALTVGGAIDQGTVNIGPSSTVRGSLGIAVATGSAINLNSTSAVLDFDASLLSIDGTVQGPGNLAYDSGAQINVPGGTLSLPTRVLSLAASNQLTISGSGSVSVQGLALSSTSSIAIFANGKLTTTDQVTVDGSLAIQNSGQFTVGGLFFAPTAAVDFDAGTIVVNAFTSLGESDLDKLLGTQHSLYTGRALTINDSFAPASVVRLDGGVLTVAFFNNPQLLEFNSGTFNLTGANLTVGTAGFFGNSLLLPAGKAIGLNNQLNIQSGAELIMQDGRLSAGSILNNGLIRGTGRLTASSISNAGELRVAAADTLRCATSNVLNFGQINLLGGAVDASGATITNQSTGRINGRGLVRANQTNNFGTMTFSGGLTDFVGDLIQAASSKTIVTGGAVATFYDDVSNNSGSEFRTSTNSTAVFLATVTGLAQFTGTGTTIFEGPASFGRINKSGSTLISVGGDLIADAILDHNLAVEGVAGIIPNGTNAATSRVNMLTIQNAGRLDLSNNSMIIDYTGLSPVASVRGYIVTGRNGGNWLGNGLTSSVAATDPRTALGLVEATQLGSPATFFGQPIDNTTLLTRYTLYGDGDLNGTVNITDFAFLAANFNVATNSWFLGDYDYNGTTNISDFALLASNFNLSLPGDLPRGGAVPEPAALGLISALAVTLQRRCRAKK